MTYREQPAGVPGAVLWERETAGAAMSRILPDGCLDLIWDGRHLVVAGPDTRARMHQVTSATRFTALRFSGGLGPALLGVPAHELRDTSPDLADVWSGGRGRRLTERVAAAPREVLLSWLQNQAAPAEVDPLGARIVRMARAGTAVARMADVVGLTSRQLHRRSLALFGYGPQHLVRVLRLERALGLARAGTPLVRVAYECGYADQAHLARDVRDLTGVTAMQLLASGG